MKASERQLTLTFNISLKIKAKLGHLKLKINGKRNN